MSRRRRPSDVQTDLSDAERDAERASNWMARVFGGRFGLLMILLLFQLLMTPIFIDNNRSQTLLALFGSAVMIASIHAARPAGRAWTVGIVLAVADFLIGRIVAMPGARWLVAVQAALWISSMLFVIKAILDVIFSRGNKVSVETLQAALCVYLLAGLLWTYFYASMDLVIPNGFLSHGEPRSMWVDDATRHRYFLQFLLFSFATQSAAPYDGLAPGTGFTNMCSFLQAMTSQIYLAVVIARLVGIQSADIAEGRQ